jgi:hypothetical protein
VGRPYGIRETGRLFQIEDRKRGAMREEDIPMMVAAFRKLLERSAEPHLRDVLRREQDETSKDTSRDVSADEPRQLPQR